MMPEVSLTKNNTILSVILFIEIIIMVIVYTIRSTAINIGYIV